MVHYTAKKPSSSKGTPSIALVFIILISLLSCSCSAMLIRSAKYSHFKLKRNYTRDKVIAEIGNPETTITETPSQMKSTIDTYTVRGRIFDSGDYWGSTAGWPMTWGLSELILFPMEAWKVISQCVYPTKKQLEIHYLNDNYYQQYVKRLPQFVPEPKASPEDIQCD